MFLTQILDSENEFYARETKHKIASFLFYFDNCSNYIALKFLHTLYRNSIKISIDERKVAFHKSKLNTCATTSRIKGRSERKYYPAGMFEHVSVITYRFFFLIRFCKRDIRVM